MASDDRRLYVIWRNMLHRCLNPHHPKYPNYGGRGITVCQRWQDSFEAFKADLGPRPSLQHTMDRVNNDGNYEPTNIRWATVSEQNLNRRRWAGRSRDLQPRKLFVRPISLLPVVNYDTNSNRRWVIQKFREGCLPHPSVLRQELGLPEKLVKRWVKEYLLSPSS